ncbi:DEHA2A00968p [Debaryomyces hansenii CBS767]|uniref:DEHA2A00968p n=1 Tax=Debaryomyces hansenii (strain ATCC 36239 / CBS 767 / BCRC 21394 / JCM 1990 / NBRC 0083 / IGC 2968) TaxID=284592 RepID=Q6BZI9_DEBHA|nr:DEHA2A00968p [Debaryomyces hansenii CBS767]CAG84327.1 DEHA2A00968p [Debaryomyces hansenii CBS767]|eukprot:XP_456380.1 DEHA2A00968p [Debaryomyces hansenii CBS767]
MDVPHKRGYMKFRLDRYYLTKGYFNLSHYIETIPLDNKDIELYRKAKGQLEVIHRHGIIHGDIKTENILCARDGKVYIIDFAFSVTKNEWNTQKSMESDISDLKYVFGLDEV